VNSEEMRANMILDLDLQAKFLSMSSEEKHSHLKSLLDGRLYSPMTVYQLEIEEREPTGAELNRANCDPIGITEDRWPTFDGAKMYHLLTLDFHTTPNLEVEILDNTRAISVFVSHPMNLNHDAKPQNSTEFEIVQLQEQDIALGVVSENPPFEFDEPRVFRCNEFQLPAEMFDHELMEQLRWRKWADPRCELAENFSPDIPFEILNEITLLINLNNVAGSLPTWKHHIEPDLKQRRAVLQCDNELVDLNLGDGGSLTVFSDFAIAEVG